MFYFRLAWTAIRSLEAHFLRSLLATLGVLIGVSSVVACMSILEGMSNDVLKRFQSMGSNVLYVFPASARIRGASVGPSQTLTMGDIDTLTRALPDDITMIAPEALGSATIKRFQEHQDATVVATSSDYFEINVYKPRSGRTFTKNESNDETINICLLGYKLTDKLFGGIDPVGQTVKVGSTGYRVVGVMEKKGSLGFLNADEAVFIPIQSGLGRYFNRKWLNRLTVAAKDVNGLEDLQKKITKVLREAHRIGVGENADFDIFNQEEAMQNVNQFMFIWKLVFYSIAGISLVVGGIGIMNIMLVSVTERTREIGVRMALGARRLDILIQFLVEATVISMVGGVFGLLLGAMASDLMNKVLEEFNFTTEVSAYVIAIAFLTTSIVGIVSGLYPAFKASRLDPVEALRFE